MPANQSTTLQQILRQLDILLEQSVALQQIAADTAAERQRLLKMAGSLRTCEPSRTGAK